MTASILLIDTTNIAKNIAPRALLSQKRKEKMKVSVEDILNIRPGGTRVFTLETSSQCHSARALVGYVKRCCMPKDIGNYETLIDWKSNSIAIRAVKKD